MQGKDAAEKIGKEQSVSSKIYTMGSAEALLNLLFIAQGKNDGGDVDPYKVLEIVWDYTREKPERNPFEHYMMPRSENGIASDPFLCDIEELASEGLIRLNENGRVQVVLLGQCMAFARSLPNPIADLGKRVEQLAIEGLPS